MTEEKKLECIKLISVFMGGAKSHFGDYIIFPLNSQPNAFGKTDYEDIKYASSWDWLIHVIDKIRRQPNVIYFEISFCLGVIVKVGYNDKCHTYESNDLIEPVFLAIVDFINFYNNPLS